MGNKRWVFRLEHNSIKFDNVYGIGPYYFLNRTGVEEFKMREDVKKTLEQIDAKDIKLLAELCVSQEPFTESKLKYREHYKAEPTCRFEKKMLPCSFYVKRPGPWNDPVLHQTLLDKGINLLRDKLDVRFGFDSREQLNCWFDNSIEFDLFLRLGFGIIERKLESSRILFGLRQCCIIP